ncbi:hypothetical protein V6N13_071357 [Hibiscus sabdariffa]
MEALTKVFPSATHRTCVRHLCNNFKNSTNFKGKHLKDLLWKAARATYQKEFEDAMAELKAMSNDVSNWLNGKDPSQWSKSHFSSFCKTGMLLSNLSECFNKMILEARDKLILTLMEMVKTKIMQKIIMKKEEANKYTGILCFKIQAKVELTTQQATRRPPGRPKKKRVEEVDEPSNYTCRFTKRGATMYCSECRKAGHNQRTCKGEVDSNIPVNAPRGTTNQMAELQSHPNQQPPSVIIARWMPTSQESYNVGHSPSNTLTQNVQEDINYEGVGK